jgi:hypothetical protein
MDGPVVLVLQLISLIVTLAFVELAVPQEMEVEEVVEMPKEEVVVGGHHGVAKLLPEEVEEAPGEQALPQMITLEVVGEDGELVMKPQITEEVVVGANKRKNKDK